MGVDVFFVLSGYLITGILMRERGRRDYLRRFYWRRFLRIFPPYYLFLTIVFLLDATTRQGWYWHVFYLSNVRESLGEPSAGYITPLWSLAIEEQSYLVWPLAVAVLPRRAFIGACATLMILMAAARAVGAEVFATFGPTYHLLRFDALAAGAVLYLYWPSIRGRVQRAPWVPLALAGALGAAMLALHGTLPDFRTSANSVSFNLVGYSMVLGISVCLLITALVADNQPLLRTLGHWRPLVWIGTISYAVYLCHKAMIHLVSTHLHVGRTVDGVLALCASLAVASLSWVAIEKPLMKIRNRAPQAIASD
jgi:peptidoglycan/LPS O-acetylase OafA/YrhL